MSTGPEHTPRRSPGETLDVVYGVALCHLTPIAVFIRRDFGTDALGWNALLGGLGLYVIFAETGDPFVLLAFFAWFAAQATQRFRSLRNRWRGVRVHSRYAGYPWLAMRLPGVTSEAVAVRIGEPLFCLAVGAVLWLVSHPLGWFVMLGVVSFLIRNTIDREILRRRLQQLEDARIEQEWYAAQLSGRR